VIFHCYVKLPEGRIDWEKGKNIGDKNWDQLIEFQQE